MAQETKVTPPEVMWAQSSTLIFVTICLEDCENPNIIMEPNRIYFKGNGGADKKLYEVEVKLYKEIEPEKCKKKIKGRAIELELWKKTNNEEKELYWPQLTNEKAKFHWLKIDFNRWQNEDSSGDESDAFTAGEDDEILPDMLHLMEDIENGDTSGISMDDFETEDDTQQSHLNDLLSQD